MDLSAPTLPHRPRVAGVLASVVRYGIYAALATPLIVVRVAWSPTNVGKVFVFRAIIALASVAWAYLALSDPSWRPRRSHISLAIVGVLGVSLLSGLFGAHPDLSFWGEFERMGGWLTLAHYGMFFLLLTVVARHERNWIAILGMTVTVGFGSVLYGFLQLTRWQFILGSSASAMRERIFGTIGNPAMFAGYALLILYATLLLAILLARSLPRRRSAILIGAVIASLMLSVAIILTGVRAAAIALVFSALCAAVSFIAFTWRRSRARHRSILLCIAGILVVSACVWLFRASPFVTAVSPLQRLTHLSLSEPTLRQRFSVWHEAFDGFFARPVLGWGPENFGVVHGRFYEPSGYFGPGGSLFDRAHNIVLETLATQGIVGIAAAGFLLFAAGATVLRIRRRSPAVAALFVGAGTAYIIQGCAFFDTCSVFLVGTVLLALLQWHSSPAPHLIRSSASPRWHVWVFLVLSLAALLFVWFTDVVPLRANMVSAQAAVAFSIGDTARGAALMEQSMSRWLPSAYRFSLMHNVAQVHVDASMVAAIDEHVKRYPDLIDAHLDAVLAHPESDSSILEQAALRFPRYPFLWQELGHAYIRVGRYTDAGMCYDRASALTPATVSLRYFAGKARLLQGKIAEGLDLIRTAVGGGFTEKAELIGLGQFMSSQHRLGEYIPILVSAAGQNPDLLAYVATAYNDMKNRSAARKAADSLMALNGADADPRIAASSYVLIADLYKKLGDIPMRTRALEKAGVLAPLGR